MADTGSSSGVNWSGVATSAGGSAAGALFGGLFGLASARLNYKYTKRLMALQNQYQIAAFNREMQGQKDLSAYNALNESLWKRAALRNAGYSTANPDGTGYSPMAVSSPSQDTPQIPNFSGWNAMTEGAMQGALAAANIRLANAQASKTESETDYQLMYNDLYQIYGESQMKSALDNLNADTKLKVAQEIYNMNNADAVKNLSEANIKNIEQRLDMDWQKLPKELQLLSAQAYEAQEKGNLSHAEISKVWQDIKESQQRIVNLQHEVALTDAQVAVAYALTSVYAAQEGNILVDTNGKVIENSLNRLNRDIQEGLGVGWHQAALVLSSFIPFAGASVLLNRGK